MFTGTVLACEHANLQADFICLGKALTAGFLPMSAVLTTDAIYETFYDDYHKGKSFLHSHTFSGNALAAAVALEAQQVYAEENIGQQVKNKERKTGDYFHFKNHIIVVALAHPGAM